MGQVSLNYGWYDSGHAAGAVGVHMRHEKQRLGSVLRQWRGRHTAKGQGAATPEVVDELRAELGRGAAVLGGSAEEVSSTVRGVRFWPEREKELLLRMAAANIGIECRCGDDPTLNPSRECSGVIGLPPKLSQTRQGAEE